VAKQVKNTANLQDNNSLYGGEGGGGDKRTTTKDKNWPGTKKKGEKVNSKNNFGGNTGVSERGPGVRERSFVVAFQKGVWGKSKTEWEEGKIRVDTNGVDDANERDRKYKHGQHRTTVVQARGGKKERCLERSGVGKAGGSRTATVQTKGKVLGKKGGVTYRGKISRKLKK